MNILDTLKQSFSELAYKSSPDDFVFFDLETSSLNIYTCEILEIAGIKVRNGKIIDSFSSLVRNQYTADASALAVNGIKRSELKNAPKPSAVIPKFVEFVGKSTVAGYNIARFDLPILARYVDKYCKIAFCNPYFDVLQMANKKLPELIDHKLTTIAAYFGIDTNYAHQALTDSKITFFCFEQLKNLPDKIVPIRTRNHTRKYNTQYTPTTKALRELQTVLQGVIADGALTENEVIYLKKWIDDHSNLIGNYPYDRIFDVLNEALADGILEPHELDEMLLLFQEQLNPMCSDGSCLASIQNLNIVLTGDFSRGDKDYIENIVTDHGGVVKSSVSSKTNIVIVGALGSPNWKHGNYGAKIKKAKELQTKGSSIRIITEDSFFNFIS